MPRGGSIGRLREVLIPLTKEQRAKFLLKFAEIYGRVYPREYDEHGYVTAPKKKRFPRRKGKEPLDTIGEPPPG